MPRGQAPGYTDAQARAVHCPLSFPPVAFVPGKENYAWDFDCNYLSVGRPPEAQPFYAPVLVPQGVTITKLTLFGLRNTVLDILELTLQRGTRAGVTVVMATVTADWITGDSSGYDDSIDYAIIDNELYNYVLELVVLPDATDDAKYAGALIEFAG